MSAKQTVFESTAFECHHYPELNALITVVKIQVANFDELKQVNAFELDFIKKHNLTNFCVSPCEGYVASPDEMEWLQQTHVPALLGAGIRKFANIVSENIFTLMAQEAWSSKIETGAGMVEMRFCTSLDGALSWFAE